MHIDYVTNAKKVGDVELVSLQEKKLKLNTNTATADKNELKSDVGRVYFLTVNGMIKKIGGSQCKGGIVATIAPYLGGFALGMSPRSYCGWNYIRQQLLEGNKVEFYFILAPSTRAKIPTMNDYKEIIIPVDFHQIEHACVQEFKQQEQNQYPELNVQESGKKWRDLHGPRGPLLEGYPGIVL